MYAGLTTEKGNDKLRAKKKQKMGLGRKIILVICLIVFFGSAGVLLDYFLTGLKEQQALEDLEKLRAQKADMVTDKGTVIGKYVDLYLKNGDIIGWIDIDDTKVNYPVMWTPNDPEYYLRRDFNKQHTSAGTPFMDSASDIFIPTSNFFIYGHNMKNGTMFHDLLKYDDREFYESHRTLKFDTIYKGGQGTYEVIAAGYTKIYPKDSKAFKYYQYAGITSKVDFDEYIRGVKKLSVYDTGVSAEYGDQLVTLSTCAYHEKDGRFFVVAKRIDAKQGKPQ